MCDFIVAAKRHHSNSDLHHQHQLNLSNCLAQSRILALGDSVMNYSRRSPQYKRYPGNQPCTTLLIKELTPFNFGRLIALYEHKVYVQSVIWNINPFDQWGVELGKTVATELMGPLTGSEPRSASLDASTRGLLDAINNHQ
jgi:glucose-6-phosphate isomerase